MGKKVVVYTSYGDAVKNFSDDVNVYDVLTGEFQALDYESKADIMKADNVRKVVRDNPRDLKMWSRQQWPYNSLKYAQQNNIHVVYIQSDYNYCKYPSLFAEAMCGLLYTRSQYIADAAFHFSGPDNDLFCVGPYEVADKLKQIATSFDIPIISVSSDIGDYEWMNMTDEFMNSYYNYRINQKGNPLEWMRYPWNFMSDKLDRVPAERIVEVKSITGIPETLNVKYVKDLQKSKIARGCSPSTYRLSIKCNVGGGREFRGPLQGTWSNIPIDLYMYDMEDPVTIFVSFNLYNSPIPAYVFHENMTFDGTVDRPRLVFNDGRVVEYEDMAKVM